MEANFLEHSSFGAFLEKGVAIHASLKHNPKDPFLGKLRVRAKRVVPAPLRRVLRTMLGWDCLRALFGKRFPHP